MNLNWSQKYISSERSALGQIQTCGLQILVNFRDGNIGSDEIRNPSDILSRCSLESCFSLVLERIEQQELSTPLI